MRIRQTLKARRGAILVLVALCLVALLGVVALVVDGGLLFDRRRHAQAGADSAALAAAEELFLKWQQYSGNDTTGSAKTAALTNASANGYGNDGTTSVVTVNIPPTSGSFANQVGYAEVIIQFNHKRGFSTVFGGGDMPVRARAVARGLWVPFGSGIIALDPTASGAVTDVGNGVINVTGGASVIVDSNSATAITANGNATVSASSILVTGGYSGTGYSPSPTTGVQATPDPLAYLPMPDPVALGLTSQTYKGGSATLNPGIYTGGISISGQTALTLNPGIYYMKGGGFSTSGQASLTGHGVLIYSDGGAISLTGNGNLDLSPITTGIYQGITIMMNRTSTAQVKIAGNGSLKSVTGTVYAPGSPLQIAGNGTLTSAQLIADTVKTNGNGGLTVNWNGNTAKTRKVGLVE
jgi:Flp pilus assembly protein TadG